MRTELQENRNSETKDVEKMENHRTVIPAVDIFENDHEIWMIADLPGVREKDIEVHFEKQTLRISGRVKPVDASWRRTLREYVPTDFERTFKLPSGLDVSKFSADYENGVLTLHLPKSEEHQPHKIQINARK
jgi:HSP20 family molecular chaperone IbpA